jgi:hypothetical protein
VSKPRRKPSKRLQSLQQLGATHSLLGQYNGVKHSPRVAAIVIEDPYAAYSQGPATAVAPPQSAATNDGPVEWRAPARPRLEVLAAIRDDVAAKMYARHQIDEASFLAARNYQSVYERAEAARRVSSVDLEMPPISGGRGGDFQGADMVLRATKELKQIEGALLKRSGEDGVILIRDVLGVGKTIEAAAAERGDSDGPRIWGGTFRRCLRHLAEITGFAVPGAYRNLQHRMQQEQRQLQQEREREREKKKRKGKPNGHDTGSQEPSPASA